MQTYNVFYSVKDEVDPLYVADLVREFIALLSRHELIESAVCHQLTNKGNFPDMPDFHIAVHFKHQAHMSESFRTIRDTWMHEYPHAQLMASTKEFKVTFTESF